MNNHQNIPQNLAELLPFQVLELKQLSGYDNQNFLITSNKGKFILKSYPFSVETYDLLQAEIKVLQKLSESALPTPSPVPFTNQSLLHKVTVDGEVIIFRLLTYLEGTFMGDMETSPEVVKSLGRTLAKLDQALSNKKDYVLEARTWPWDLQHLPLNKPLISYIKDPEKRKIARYFFQQYDENVTDELPYLRKQIIHNDGNEWNVLVSENQVSGIIDFGDLTYSPLINELAVAMTYCAYNKPDPLKWCLYFLEGYCEVQNIEEKEAALLYYLIAGRLCTSVCNSASAKANDPDNTYAQVSEQFAWSMLFKWIEINPQLAENEFRKAASLPMITPKPVEKVLDKRFEIMSPSLSVSYKKPIYMQGAAFQYMYDAYGNTFLDAYNNIPHVGHQHPKVVDAGQKQIAKLNTNTRYLYDQLAAYAEKLLSKFPPHLNKVFFVNSGSAATDLALRMATNYTGRQKFMVMEHGYHGNTQAGIDISDYKFNNKHGQGQKPHILKAPIPDTFRGKFKGDDSLSGEKYARETVQLMQKSEGSVAAFISEPIVGCGGQVPLAPGYLKKLYPAIRNQGGVCISDEVQTGFGRVGDHFWGYEAQGVVPDIVILGKPIANGHPMGAVVTTNEIAESFDNGVEFFSSFGGNPVSCAMASAVLEVIEEEDLQENARNTGNYFKEEMNKLKARYPVIGDVRGSGLFLGFELVNNGEDMEPDTALAGKIKNALRDSHILISTDGPFDNVLKSKPPLCFNKGNVDKVVRSIEEVLKNHAS